MATETVALSLHEIKEKHELALVEILQGIIEQVNAPDAEKAIAEHLGAIEKRDDLVDVLFSVEAEAERLAAMEKRIGERRREYERFCVGVREMIRFQMDNMGIKRVDGKVHRLLLREGKDSVEITDETLLPAKFIEYKPTPVKADISKALHAGEEVPGAKLIPAKKALVVT